MARRSDEGPRATGGAVDHGVDRGAGRARGEPGGVDGVRVHAGVGVELGGLAAEGFQPGDVHGVMEREDEGVVDGSGLSREDGGGMQGRDFSDGAKRGGEAVGALGVAGMVLVQEKERVGDDGDWRGHGFLRLGPLIRREGLRHG